MNELELQRALADVLLAAEPAAAWARHSELPDLDATGVRVAALLVARLRFDWLMNASAEARAWFLEDAAAFTTAFRRYHVDVPPTAAEPLAEAAAFRAWRADRA